MMRRGDKGGDVFYDLISALHKSVRGSNPDASIYWLAQHNNISLPTGLRQSVVSSI